MPYTPANVFTKKVIKCEYPNCKSSFSTLQSRKTHYSNEHKNQSIKRTKGGKVMKKKITQRKISKKKLKLAVQQSEEGQEAQE